jgi:MoaA/NifB/PqqE/SkfB family radical SAM enzyme
MKIDDPKISLNGRCLKIQARFIRGSIDFKEARQRMKDLIRSRHPKDIVFDIEVYTARGPETSNYYRLNDIVRLGLGLGIKKIQFSVVNPKDNPVASLNEVAAYLSKARYVFLFEAITKIKGMPYCLIPEPESVILRSSQPRNFVKFRKCKTCRYFKQCDGVPKGYLKNLDKNKIKPQTLPKEVMIEVTPRCNFQCKFCFNRASFARQGHGQLQEPTTAYVKKIINGIKKAKIPIVRFTGGEPLLRNDILKLIKYAKSKGLTVRLNTNGSLIKNYKQARGLVRYLDYALFSLHTFDPKKDEEITGVKNSFEKKIRAIKWFKRAGIKTIRVSTIATADNIRNLEKFYELFKKLKIDKWATNRVIPLTGEKNLWGETELKPLVSKLIKIRKDVVKNNIPLKIHIVNGVPLCAQDPVKMTAVCAGARSVDGHERFAVDPRGFAKPIYYIEKDIGNPLKPLECWNHPFIKTLRGYKSLPKECAKCVLLEKCKGGNRYCAFVAAGSYKARDPLMNFSNMKNFQW